MKYLFLVFLSIPAFGAEINCPPELRTEQKSVDAPKGWKVYEEKFNSRHMLTSVDFFDGQPDEGVRLAPNSTEGDKSTWRFEKSVTITLVCRYAHTLLTLTQELKNTTAGCEVISEKAGRPKKIFCQ